MAGFFLDFEAVRTVSSEYDAPRRSGPNVEQLVAENARRVAVARRGPKWPQNRKINHPRPPLLETTRVDGVKAPLHDGTPRSCVSGVGYFIPGFASILNSTNEVSI